MLLLPPSNCPSGRQTRPRIAPSRKRDEQFSAGDEYDADGMLMG